MRQQGRAPNQENQLENPRWPLCFSSALSLVDGNHSTCFPWHWKDSRPLVIEILGTPAECLRPSPGVPLALWSDLFMEPPFEILGAASISRPQQTQTSLSAPDKSTGMEIAITFSCKSAQVPRIPIQGQEDFLRKRTDAGKSPTVRRTRLSSPCT